MKYKKAFAKASKKVISGEDQKKNLDAFDEYIRQADELLAKMTDGLKKTKQAQNNPDAGAKFRMELLMERSADSDSKLPCAV